MPRVLQKTTERDKKDTEKLRAQETAERMKDMVERFKKATEQDILESLIRMPASDIQEKQATYRATMNLLHWLDSEIAKGKKVSFKLDKEEK